MSRVDTWMPLYIGDYLSDTMHLNGAEHGAYLLLIMHYWRNGPLPDDDRALAAIARTDRREWAEEVGPSVRPFFRVTEGRLHHKRIDEEMARAEQVADKRRVAAKAKWDKAKAQSDANALQMQSTCNARAEQMQCKTDANAMQTDCKWNDSHSHSHSHKLEETPLRGVGAPLPAPAEPKAKRTRERTRCPADWFPDPAGIAFAIERGVNVDATTPKFRDFHISRGNLMADWAAAWRTWCSNEGRFGSSRRPSASASDTWDWTIGTPDATPETPFDLEMTRDDHGAFNLAD